MGGLGPNNPRQIGDFDILGVVHSDAISVTYAALGPAGQRVAVTQIRSPYSEDDGVRSAFRDETAAREQLSDARIAPVVDAAPEADHPWIVRERPFGTSLRKIIDTIGPLPAPVVLRLAAELAEALAEMHQRGMLHRDLSPSNVLISPDGVRLIDFGAASGPVDGPLVLGTPGYLAPEQIIGRPAVPAGDVFSLGSVMLMAATGRDPFEASDHAVTLYKVLNEEVDLTDLPTTLRTIVERALAKDASQRPTAREIADLAEEAEPADLTTLLVSVMELGDNHRVDAVRAAYSLSTSMVHRFGSISGSVVFGPQHQANSYAVPTPVGIALSTRTWASRLLAGLERLTGLPLTLETARKVATRRYELRARMLLSTLAQGASIPEGDR